MELFDQKILETIAHSLLQKEQTIAVAESVTSGLLQYSFSNMESAARFFQGGITAYNLGQKYKHLAVEPIHAQQVNSVSEQVAVQMAKQVCCLFNSQWGIGVTGYSSVVPESDNSVYAYYAIVYNNELIKAEKVSGSVVTPPEVQLEYVRIVLDRLAETMRGL